MEDLVKTTRVQIELPEKSMTRLRELKEKTEASSYAEVIKNAIRIYEYLVLQHEQGNEVFIKNSEHNEFTKCILF